MTTITSKFTKERLIDWAVVAVAERGRDLKDAPESVEAAANLKLAEIALASLTAEPVRYLNKFSGTCVTLEQQSNAADDVAVYIPLYATPPAPVVPEECPEEIRDLMASHSDALFNDDDAQEIWNACRTAMLNGDIFRENSISSTNNFREIAETSTNSPVIPDEKGASLQLRNLIRHRHAEWSDATFGNVGPVGPLKHLSKEALEAAAEPDDISEWADMQFLLWDAQRRAGISDGEITAAMEEKLKVNMARQWPEPKDGEPLLHIKEQPAPVVPEECPAELPYAQVKAVADLFALCWQSGEVVTYTPDPEKATIWLNNYSGTCVQEYVKLERLQEALAGNSLVIPDGWKLAPEKADEDMIAEGNIMASCMIETVGKVDVSLIYGAMLAAAPEKETGPCTK